MTEEQINHREQIILDWSNSYRPIYDNGAKEHQTVMSTLPVMMMVQEGMNEAQDNYAYNHVAKAQLEKVRTRLGALKHEMRRPTLLFSANNRAKIQPDRLPRTTIYEAELRDEVVRRVEAIERILFG